jgi:hypothetical protein
MTRRAVVIAAALYLAATLVMTWPLATVAHREIAWDLGDPVFNSWVLLWTSGQVLAFLSGDVSALNRFWHGNIFHPERLTVAYSEHLTPQMLQALPVLAATDNVVLAYNLLFLSTFVLCGVGMFLWVRQMTGSPVAGFVAGLAFAFAPYRMAQLSHLQVLSVQWMPLVLYGYRLYFDTGRRRRLVWGSVAFVVQNLSCGYYLLFFAPFVAMYVLFEMAARGRLADWREWRRWVVTGALVLLATAPFLEPYLDVRRSGDVGVRHPGEIALFSADTHALGTAAPHLPLWGERVAAFPRAEGEGFPGFTILALALVGITAGALQALRGSRATGDARPAWWRDALTGAIVTWWIAGVLASLSYLITGGLPLPYDGTWAIHRQADATLAVTLGLTVALVLVSATVRRLLWGAPHAPAGFLFIAALTATVLAFGPLIHVEGRPIAAGPYGWLVEWLPGFDGVRVPARFFMVMALFLAALVGVGVHAVSAGRRKAWAFALAGLISTGVLVESWPGRFQTNVRLAADGLLPTPRTLASGRHLPPVYQSITNDTAPVIVVEFPFGSIPWDLFSMYYAGYHKRPLVNGYSGFFPESQRTLVTAFRLVDRDPDAAWRALVGTRATHAVVHEDAFPNSQRGLYADWLRAHGATEILTDGSQRLFRIR